MYIKTLTIQGFKSYRDQIQIEPFSPRHNVVVGRNGSGKSNFFAAIRFVLSDAYTSMSREERQSLLHEGPATTATLSAYVEIVFDNSDNRFPTGHEEVILRRTIGVKKDEYTLDKKSASKADVMNLLESAGFSRANPYYIVPQGRITALTNAKDHERLTLLKEVAGTKVYEQRRAETLKIMAETESKRAKTQESLENMEAQMQDLESEKEELKEFQEKDKERRCIEYALYQSELNEVQEALENLDEDRKAAMHGSNVRTERYNARDKEIQELESAVSEHRHTLEALSSSRQETQSELTELIGNRTTLECIITDLETTTANSVGQRQELQGELAIVKRQIVEKEKALAKLLVEWQSQKDREASEKRKLDEANAKLETLFAKRGRVSKFRTKAERDKFLTNEIQSIEQYQVSQAEALERAEMELESAKGGREEIQRQIAALQEKIQEEKNKYNKHAEDIVREKEEQADLMEKRKDAWREDSKLDSLLGRATDEMKTAERQLASMMDKDTGAGLRSVDKIAERFKLKGVYGPLYRLFEVTDFKFNTAVELTAGNSLFHVVVDTDDTAARVLDVMLKEKTGRVTFMPLNRLKPSSPSLPDDSDAIPLLQKLEYDPLHEKAFKQVFGKTCVCRDLSVAATYVRSHGINGITLDGDKVDRKGVLTGGYYDIRKSRIDAIKAVTTWRAKYEEEKEKSNKTKTLILELDQKITKIAGHIQICTAQQAQSRDWREKYTNDTAALMREKDAIGERILRLKETIEELKMEKESLVTRLDSYKIELRSPMTKGLTPEEEAAIESLGIEVEKRKKDMQETAKKTTKLEGQKSAIEIELNERLKRRAEELASRLERVVDYTADSETSPAEDLESRKRELKTLNKSIQTLTSKIEDMETQTEKIQSEIQMHLKSLDTLQAQQQEDEKSMSRQKKTTERYLAKRQMCLNRKEECNRNIRDLGVLPEEAFEKYTNEKLERLVKKLQAINEALKRFSHVNKKAFEQYNNFTKDRESLLRRKEEQDRESEAINELIENLDQQKDEAIERTFKQVAKNFGEVFEKLVPAGRGRLIIQRKIDQDAEADEDEETQQTSVDNYTGVSIKVSFNSKVDEGLRIQQLSGGQKSLVALALVFAIQKCDPAPFYLFDEIDANLDAQYRTAVAAMIQSLASTGQFITTTFRPEMLVTADQFYGVLFNNQKVSSIRCIKREEAMEFVDQEAQAQ